MSKVCRHCSTAISGLYPRQLCRGCYYNLDIRKRYPSTSKYAARGLATSNTHKPLPEPTDAMPGSEGKLQVLETRVQLGQALFHPKDAPNDE